MITLTTEATRPPYLQTVVVTCRFCERWDNEMVPAAFLGGQWEGGDENEDPVWVPICNYHAAHWFESDVQVISEEERLPLIKLDVKEAQTIHPPRAPREGLRHTAIRAHMPAIATRSA